MHRLLTLLVLLEAAVSGRPEVSYRLVIGLTLEGVSDNNPRGANGT